MGWGAAYGPAGAVLANLVLAVMAGFSSLLAEPGDFGLALGLMMLIVVIGTMVAGFLGVVVGPESGSAGHRTGVVWTDRQGPPSDPPFPMTPPSNVATICGQR